MAPKYINLPTPEADLYRGDDWNLRFTFSEDVSAQDFKLQFKRTTTSALVVEATIDDSEAGGSEPFFIDATIAGADTATIAAPISLLEGELQVSATETWLRFTIPVKGQFTT